MKDSRAPTAEATGSELGALDGAEVRPKWVPTAREVLFIVGAALVYFAAARLSLRLLFKPEGIAAVWPPEGIYLCAILLMRREARPWLIAVVCLADLSAELVGGTSLPVGAAYALAAAGAATFSAFLLLRFVGPRIDFSRVRDLVGLLGLAVLLSNATMSLTAAAAAQSVAGHASFWHEWEHWAVSSGVGNLVVTPFVLSWAAGLRDGLGKLRWQRAPEEAALFCSLALLGLLVLPRVARPGDLSLALTYVTFPFLLWAALRFGVRGTSAAIVLLAAIVVRTALTGHLIDVITVQLYLASVAVPALMLAIVVAERARGHDALRDSETRYRALAETSPDLMFVIGRDDRVQYVNSRAAQMFRRTPAEVVGASRADLFDPETARGMGAHLEEVFTSAKASEYESELNYPTGRAAVSTWLVPITDDRGAVSAVFGVSRDITERKRAEEAVARLAAIVASADDAILSKTLEGTIVTWNQGAERLYGYSAEETIGQSIALLTPPDCDDQLAMLLDKVRRGIAVEHYETVRRRKDGSSVEVSLSISPIRDPAGVIVGAATIARDVTERKRAQEEILRLNAELEQRVQERTARLEAANKELEAFTYSVSHDLRAPLRHISGFANVLVEVAADSLDEEGRHCLDVITSAVAEMDVLIDDLLQFSRIGRVEVQTTHVDMEEALSEALLPLKGETRGRAIEWSVGPLPLAVGDHSLLRQVWANLLDNAVKYSRARAPAHIEIGALDGEAGSREAVYFVRDNGVGFDMRYADKLFRVFGRLHSSAEFEGTGIGLANVQRVIARLGGRVWAEAELDKGATFFFSLPRPKETR